MKRVTGGGEGGGVTSNQPSLSLEQIFVDSEFGLFQAGIQLTTEILYLYENSRETFTKNRYSDRYLIPFQEIIDIRLRDPQEFQEEVFQLPKTSQLLGDPCFQKKTCHVLRLYFREQKDQRGSSPPPISFPSRLTTPLTIPPSSPL